MALSKFAWKDGKIISLEDAVVNIFSPSIQYGWAGFEGIRFYNTENGPAVFRLPEHLDRLFYTAEQLRVEIHYTPEELTMAIYQLILENKMNEGYIRPCFLHEEAELGLRFKSKQIACAIALSSWDQKLQEKILRAKISPVVRIHPDSSDVKAKICGHYVNSIRALRDAQDEYYDEAILLDYQGYVAEGSAENLFVVKDGDLFTPPLGTILQGITRDTVITLAEDNNYQVFERHLTVDDLLKGDEVFLCGTAMEILPVVSIDKHSINNSVPGAITKFVAELYQNVVRGEVEKYHDWLAYVEGYKEA